MKIKKICFVLLTVVLSCSLQAGESWDSCMKAGLKQYKKRKYADAVTTYGNAVTLAKDKKQKAKAVMQKCSCLFRLRKYQQSLDELEKIINDYKPETYMRFKLDRKKIDTYTAFRKAKYYRMILEYLSPEYIAKSYPSLRCYLYLRRGLAYSRLGQYKNANKELDASLKLNPYYKPTLTYKKRIEAVLNLHNFVPEIRKYKED